MAFIWLFIWWIRDFAVPLHRETRQLPPLPVCITLLTFPIGVCVASFRGVNFLNMEKLVFSLENEPMTSSWLVARKFGKEHRHVLRDIRNILEGMTKIGHTPIKFIPSTYVNPQNGVEYPLYIMDEDAFSLLVMGFTGEMALKFKVDFIKQFRAMREYIKEQKKSKSKPQSQTQYQPMPDELSAKIAYADAMLAADIKGSFRTLSQSILLTSGRKITRPQLISWMHDNGYLTERDGIRNYPTQWAMEMGFLMLVFSRSEVRYDRPGKTAKPRTKITPKGMQHFIHTLTKGLPALEKAK